MGENPFYKRGFHQFPHSPGFQSKAQALVMQTNVEQKITQQRLHGVYAKMVAASVIWGGTFVAGRFLAGSLPPLLLSSLRFTLASLTLGIFLAATRARPALPDRKQFCQLVILGFFGVFAYNIFFFYGLTYTTASRASLVVALNPAMIALACWLFLGEPLRRLQKFGIVLCILGSGMVIVSQNGAGAFTQAGGLSGDVIILGCVFSWTVYSVCARSLSRQLGALVTVCYSIWFGTIILCAVSFWLLPAGSLSGLWELPAASWLALAYLGVVGSAVAYVWYYDAIRWIGAARSGAFIALNPLSAVLLGVLLFGESIGPLVGLGGLLAVAGIYLSNRTGDLFGNTRGKP